MSCSLLSDRGCVRCSQLVKVLMNLDDGQRAMVASKEMISQIYGRFPLAVSDLRLIA
jgi:hypothetical protein